jgi:hypothetical protein
MRPQVRGQGGQHTLPALALGTIGFAHAGEYTAFNLGEGEACRLLENHFTFSDNRH